MAELTLSDTQQFALRALLGAEPIEGEPLPKTTVLDQIARLIPCDAIGAALGGNDGWARAEVTLPRGYADSYGATCDGPWYLGVQTWAHIPEESEGLAAGGLVDTLTAGFRTGRDEVAQVWLDRRTREFSRQDLDMLSLIAPPFSVSYARPRPSGSRHLSPSGSGGSCSTWLWGCRMSRSPHVSSSRPRPCANTSRTPTGSSV